MAEVVNPLLREAGGSQLLLEAYGDAARFHRPIVDDGQDQAQVAPLLCTGRLERPPVAVLEQGCDRHVRQGKGSPALFGLRFLGVGIPTIRWLAAAPANA